MAIPSTMEVNDIMSEVGEGNLITIAEIRPIVAQKHGADTYERLHLEHNFG